MTLNEFEKIVTPLFNYRGDDFHFKLGLDNEVYVDTFTVGYYNLWEANHWGFWVQRQFCDSGTIVIDSKDYNLKKFYNFMKSNEYLTSDFQFQVEEGLLSNV
jgi:hypothetical protein